MDINTHYRALGESRSEARASVPLLSSQLEEKHSIFGGVDRLKQCIAYAVEEYQPKCLVLAGSCVAGVIGDDVEAVAKEHAKQFANGSLSEMQIQQKLFEVRAHEQDLRDENLNAEADYYIKMFTKHLKKTNPDLAKQIK
jgi:nitrogenase molybdenum-iron protein alpha/beta subunit